MAIAKVYSTLSVKRLDNWQTMSLLGRLLNIGTFVLKITCLASFLPVADSSIRGKMLPNSSNFFLCFFL